METKICKTCATEKPIGEFARCGASGKYRCASCKSCRAQKAAQFSSRRETTRTCKGCGTTKGLDDFPLRRKDGIDYRSHLCRKCYNTKATKGRPSIAGPDWIPPHRPFTDPATRIEMKRCRSCGVDKPLTEFSWQRGKRRANCKPCEATEQNERYKVAPEKYRKISLEWARRNPDKVKARYKLWYENNREYALGQCRIYNAARKDGQREYNHKRRTAPGFNQEYYQKHRKQAIQNAARRRARRANAPVVEKINVSEIVARDSSTCYLCGRILEINEVTLDHVVPLARGGSHINENLRVACRSCNGRKKDKLLSELDWVKA